MAVIGNSATQQAFTPAVDYFSGNGSTTAFTLSRPVASVAQVQAVIDNVVQNPSSAYTVSSNTITFTSAPLSGTNNIYVRYTSPITQVIAPGQGTVNTTALGNITNIASGNSSLTLQTGSSPTTAVTIDTSQNVGIGTSSPQAPLDITKALGLRINEDGVGTNVVSYRSNYASLGPATVVSTASPYLWYINGAERMRIDSSGRLLVNKTSTSSTNGAKVYVAGHFSQPTGTANTDGTSDAKNYGYGWCASASEDAMAGLITSNLQGNWGMDLYVWLRNSGGGTLNNRFQISNAGACYNSTGTYGTISDINVKENITPAPNYLDRLMQVEIVKYSLKEEHSDVPTKLGVVAQQVEQIFPNIVEQTNSSDENGDLIPTKAVKYSVFVPMLIKAIQEQQALITAQAETINALTARIEALENR